MRNSWRIFTSTRKYGIASMHSVTGLYFRVLCLPAARFSLSLVSIFKELFPDVFPSLCDLALGSSVTTAVNLYFMQILLLAQSYCHSV